MSGSRRVIRLFPDAGADWPLWEVGTEMYPGQPSDYALSPELAFKLRVWQDEWDRDFDLSADPPDWRPGCGRGWSERGGEIASLLRREVESYADVEYTGRPY